MIVVTGGTGFVGRRLLRVLHERGLAHRAPSRAELDITAPTAAAFEGATAVVHLAAYIPRDYGSPDEAEMCLRVNALGTLALLQASVAAGVRRFVSTSSGNIYRAQPRAVTEEDPIYPSARAAYYLASKVAGETYADHFDRAGKLSVAIARISSVYGPGMVAAGMLHAFASRLRAGASVDVQDGGSYRSDLVYVDDVATGLANLVDSSLRGPVNLGAGYAPTTLEVAMLLAELTGRDASALRVAPAASGAPALGFSALDIRRAISELGYAPRSLRDGVTAYLGSLV